MTTIAQLAELVDRSATDPAFRQQLLSTPGATLQAVGIDVPLGREVRVVENTDGVRHLILPKRPPGFEDDRLVSPASAASEAASAGETLYAHARLVIDSWSDGGLRARLLGDPAAVLAERGITIPGVELRAIDAADGVLYLALPPAASR